MLTLTCHTTGQPTIVNPLRLSSIAPHPVRDGSLIRTVDGAVVPVAETTSEIAAMLQPAPEAAASPEPDAVKTAANMLRQLAELIGDVHDFTAGDIGGVMDGHMGLCDAGWQETAAGLERLADRLERR